MAEQDAVESCTNYYVTRRHYSTNLTAGLGTGRRGTALCRFAGQPVDVYDQEWTTREDQRYRRGKPPRMIADLPECKACARALTKMEASRG